MRVLRKVGEGEGGASEREREIEREGERGWRGDTVRCQWWGVGVRFLFLFFFFLLFKKLASH